MADKIEFGKRTTTELRGELLSEETEHIVGGKVVFPRKIRTEKSDEVKDRADLDAEYIKFADDEERLAKSGNLISAAFEIRRAHSLNRGDVKYAVKIFTVLDNGHDASI